MRWDAYSKVIVEIDLPSGPIVVGPRGVLAAVEAAFPDREGRTIHVITAGKPDGTPQPEEVNQAARVQLLEELNRPELTTFGARGGDLQWEHTGAGVAVIGLVDDEAVALGRKYGQQVIFAWRPESWELINCFESRQTSDFAWGAVLGAADALSERPDFSELTQWAAGPRLPRVSWDEVRDHLKKRLMMDDEWIVEGDGELVWWPTPLPLRIYVGYEDELPDGDNRLRVHAETDIAFTEDGDLGIQIASQYRHRYPTGTLIFEDGWLRLCAAIALNPQGRSTLTAFHESILIQASVAFLELAGEWSDIEGLLWRGGDAFAHPQSGDRRDLDELVKIYGPTYRQPSKNPRWAEETAYAWFTARQFLRQNYVRQGWLEGFTNDEVDYYYAPDDELVELVIGVNPDDWRVEKFGLGLNLWARLLPQGVAFDDHDANAMNIALMREFPLTVLGHITGGSGEEQRGSILSAYLPLNVWAEYASRGPVDMAVTVGNAAAACAMVSRTFRNWFTEMTEQSEA